MSRTTLALLLSCLATAAQAQVPVLVSVRAGASSEPIAGALVILVSGGRSVRTDRAGEARFLDVMLPDSVRVVHIGFAPLTLPIDPAAPRVFATLESRPPTLGEISVVADPAAQEMTAGGTWVIPRALVRDAPAAIEPDVLRSLALLPAVSFSSVLSARPILRGYDAGETSIRIDGFELVNPYHIARAFSALPAEAIREIAVSPAVSSPADGGTVSGIVDLRGRVATNETGERGSLMLSPGSLSGAYGNRNLLPIFLSARRGLIETVSSLAPDASAPYAFVDLYGRSRFDLLGRDLDITAYLSRDRLGRPAKMRWTNALLGARARIATGERHSIDATLSATRFTLFSAESQLDSMTFSWGEMNRVGAGVTWQRLGATGQFTTGLQLDLRTVSSDVPNGRYRGLRRRQDHDLPVGQVFAGWSRPLVRGTLDLGLRLDATGSASILQPRVSWRRPIGSRAALTLAYARAGRLFQTVTDPQAEPTFEFVDLWFAAGTDSIPVPSAHHAEATLVWALGSIRGSAAAYVSRGSGVGELRPLTDPLAAPGAMRFGDARTMGLETRLAIGGGGASRTSAALIYVISSSERRWDVRGWIPWQLDRRHLVRAQLTAAPGRWSLGFAAEAMSGQPMRLVTQILRHPRPEVVSQLPVGEGSPSYVYAPEGGVRGPGVFRMDAQVFRRFGGPGSSNIDVGLSVTNFGFGPASPLEPIDVFEMLGGGVDHSRGVPYQRRFDVPAVPSILVRITF